MIMIVVFKTNSRYLSALLIECNLAVNSAVYKTKIDVLLCNSPAIADKIIKKLEMISG